MKGGFCPSGALGFIRERERETERRGGADLLSREEADRSSQPRSVTDGHESSGQPRALPNGGFAFKLGARGGRQGEKGRRREGGSARARAHEGERERGER